MERTKDITKLDKPPVTIRRVLGMPIYSIIGNIREDTEHGVTVWDEVELPPSVWNKGAIVSALIRMRYTADDVEAIVNNVLSDPFNDDRMSEYEALQRWRTECKEYASELMTWADEHGIGGLIPSTPVEVQESGSPTERADGMLILMQAVKLLKKQSSSLPDEDAAEVPALFPAWTDFIGKQVEVGKRLYYGGKLWKVLQDHTAQADWMPDTTPSLFAEVAADQEQGTIDNPIPYNGNMALEEGKYYTQGGVVYLCIRDTINPVYNDLSDLVGLYVQVVE